MNENGPSTVVIKALNIFLQETPDAEIERTLVANFQNQSYYQLVRNYGRDKIQDPNFRMLNMVDGRVVNMPTGGILVRPLDKKENYIKRCVAIAGDSIEVINGVLHVNGEAETGIDDREVDTQLAERCGRADDRRVALDFLLPRVDRNHAQAGSGAGNFQRVA